MELKELYSLRNNFTLIGLTGRTGSGCSRIAEILSNDFSYLVETGLRDESKFDDQNLKRKYSICKNYLKNGENWVPFEVIKYIDVLIFFILNKHGGNYRNIKKIFVAYFKEFKQENNRLIVNKLLKDIIKIDSEHKILIQNIKKIKDFHDITTSNKLRKLEKLFFSAEYQLLKNKLLTSLEKKGYLRTRKMLHWVSCNIRSTGDPLHEKPENIENIYTIAVLLNRLIKAKRLVNGNHPTKIVIDSLRNSLEIMFFKERYSAFYMVATKDVIGNSKERIVSRLIEKKIGKKERERLATKILELDATEYRTKDFAKGIFSSPDVENCIQKSDYHIFNLKKDQLENFNEKLNKNIHIGFLTREEQILKLIALIQQPGLITPSPAERAMQVANTAKLNSGCVSRKVGAVITDSSYFIKAVGWNDVAKGQTPCNLRDFTDFFDKKMENKICSDYSEFEKSESINSSSFKYRGGKPGNFKEAIIDYFKISYDNKEKDLNGRNCSFCFKTIHNYYEGEANQVHTRSLHAEENAMLQITKLGGMGISNGFLFTTASPCELCSKKAYQLGIRKIFYIDPYPGISIDQIIKCGKSQPTLIPFSGAIGNAYHKLYDPFMSQKDEITMILEMKKGQNLSKKVINVLSNPKDKDMIDFFEESKLNDDRIIELIRLGIEHHKENEARKKINN